MDCAGTLPFHAPQQRGLYSCRRDTQIRSRSSWKKRTEGGTNRVDRTSRRDGNLENRTKRTAAYCEHCILHTSSFFISFFLSSFFFLFLPPVQPHLFYPHRPAAACIPVALFWKRNQCTLASREMNPPPPISCLPLTPL